MMQSESAMPLSHTVVPGTELRDGTIAAASPAYMHSVRNIMSKCCATCTCFPVTSKSDHHGLSPTHTQNASFACACRIASVHG